MLFAISARRQARGQELRYDYIIIIVIIIISSSNSSSSSSSSSRCSSSMHTCVRIHIQVCMHIINFINIFSLSLYIYIYTYIIADVCIQSSDR